MTKRVLITGCSSGIGRALAQELSRRKFEVVATARDKQTLQDIDVAHRLALDVTNEASIDEVVAAVGRIDVLVNNAGVGFWSPIETASVEDVRRLFEINVLGPLRMLKATLPQMRARRDGVIVQISSVAGRISGPLMGHYAASKHALEAHSEALRLELAPFGLRVAIVELGAVESAFPQNRITAVRNPDYDLIVERFTRNLMNARQVPITSAMAGCAISEIIEAGAPELRYHVTPDAKSMVAARFAMSDREWEVSTLQAAGFDRLLAGA